MTRTDHQGADAQRTGWGSPLSGSGPQGPGGNWLSDSPVGIQGPLVKNKQHRSWSATTASLDSETCSSRCHTTHNGKARPRPLWLGGWSAGLWTERSRVRFRARERVPQLQAPPCQAGPGCQQEATKDVLSISLFPALALSESGVEYPRGRAEDRKARAGAETGRFHSVHAMRSPGANLCERRGTQVSPPLCRHSPDRAPA